MQLSERTLLIAAVFTAGLCSIVYELLISTTSAYFLGDSVTQFSLTIGIYMAAMGVGSLLTRYVGTQELLRFVQTELALGLLGGLSVPLLYVLFQWQTGAQYQLSTLVLTFGIGLLTGLEIPLLARVMKRYYPLRDNLANVLGFDYIGALAATLLFPFLLLPFVGLYGSSLLFGSVNVLLGAVVCWSFRQQLEKREKRVVFGWTAAGLLLFGYCGWRAEPFLQAWEAASYPHEVVYEARSPYQKIVLTEQRDDLRLYLNRVIQFSSRDEYRYHEALALIPAAQPVAVRRALVLGGGEGLLARELLKLPELDALTVVDLDTAVFDLGRRHPRVQSLNEHAFADPRLRAVGMDAAVFLRNDTNHYDLILADLPDPSNEAVARLYSTWFFGMARARLAPGGVLATQATSPYHTRRAYWSIYESLAAAGFTQLLPYRITVPSFGPWGFIMASNGERHLRPDYRTEVSARYLDPAILPGFFHFPADEQHPQDVLPNRLDRPVLLEYFLDEWRSWQREQTTSYEE